MANESRFEALLRHFYIEPFLDYLLLERGLQARSCAAYRSDIGCFVSYLDQSTDIRTLDEVDDGLLVAYTTHLRSEGLSPSSIRRAQSALRAYFGFLLAEDLISKDPTERMDRPKTAAKLPNFLSQEEAARLVEAVELDSKMYGGIAQSSNCCTRPGCASAK